MTVRPPVRQPKDSAIPVKRISRMPEKINKMKKNRVRNKLRNKLRNRARPCRIEKKISRPQQMKKRMKMTVLRRKEKLYRRER